MENPYFMCRNQTVTVKYFVTINRIISYQFVCNIGRHGMKDVQGEMRGKCNKCECKEFMSAEGRVRCEYCDHSPADHVRIIELGKCLSPQCNGVNCKKYMPENDTEYSNCQYCECESKYHEGADQRERSP